MIGRPAKGVVSRRVGAFDDKGAAEASKWIEDAVIDQRGVVVLFEFPDSSAVRERQGVFDARRGSPVERSGLTAEKSGGRIVNWFVKLVNEGVWMACRQVPRISNAVRRAVLRIAVSTPDIQSDRGHGYTPPMLQNAFNTGLSVIVLAEIGDGIGVTDPE